MIDPPPSRDSNPFATCWTRPGALRWAADGALTPEALADRLESHHWRGQLVGPHGSGKSSLLNRLAVPLEQRGRRLVRVRVDRLEGPRTMRRSGEEDSLVLALEGFERLGTLQRMRTLSWARRSGWGCVAPTHETVNAWPHRLPVLARLNPTLAIALRLYESLTAGKPTRVTRDDVAASFADCAGDMRRLWFDLYDLHESRRRAAHGLRTARVRLA